MTNKPICLVTGASGTLGLVLCRHFQRLGYDVVGQFNTHPIDVESVRGHPLDLVQEGAPKQLVDLVGPELVIHCAAITNVDQCEGSRDLVFRINGQVNGELARACDGVGAKFVMISTDQLWKAPEPFAEETLLVDPPNVYGASKAEGERLSRVNGTELIIRTNFFGAGNNRKPSPVAHVLSVLRAGKTYHGFKDVFYTPIEASLLSKLIAQAVENELSGIYNIAGRERISKLDFARRVALFFAENIDLIQPSSVADANLTAPRPSEMSLSIKKVEQALCVEMPTFDESLDAYKMAGLRRNGGNVTHWD